MGEGAAWRDASEEMLMILPPERILRMNACVVDQNVELIASCPRGELFVQRHEEAFNLLGACQISRKRKCSASARSDELHRFISCFGISAEMNNDHCAIPGQGFSDS